MKRVSQNQLTELRHLRLKKHREAKQLFTAEGVKIANEIWKQNRYNIHSIYVTEKYFAEKLPQTLHSKSFIISNKELESVSDLQTPNEIICVLHQRELYETVESNVVLALDGISDPGNLGTIIRTADWFGINTIIASENCVDVFNQKTLQSTMGSFLRVNVRYLNLCEYLQQSGKTKYAALLEGKNLHEVQFEKESIIIIGSESHGISNEILKTKHEAITIPKIGKAESLNAAIATSIICYAMKFQT